MATDTSYCLGGKNGAGFGWDDMMVYKIGGQWNTGNDWTWRAGFSHGKQPIDSSQVVFNILAPGVVEDHWTLGFTKQIGKPFLGFRSGPLPTPFPTRPPTPASQPTPAPQPISKTDSPSFSDTWRVGIGRGQYQLRREYQLIRGGGAIAVGSGLDDEFHQPDI